MPLESWQVTSVKLSVSLFWLPIDLSVRMLSFSLIILFVIVIIVFFYQFLMFVVSETHAIEK